LVAHARKKFILTLLRTQPVYVVVGFRSSHAKARGTAVSGRPQKGFVAADIEGR
jgi:hypothetical protein